MNKIKYATKALILVIITAVLYSTISNYSSVSALEELGYTKNEAVELLKEAKNSSTFVTTKRVELENEVVELVEELEYEYHINENKYDEFFTEKLVQQVELFNDLSAELRSQFQTEFDWITGELLNKFSVVYEYNDTISFYENVENAKKTLEENVASYALLQAELTQKLLDNGYSQEAINNFIVDDSYQTITNLRNETASIDEKIAMFGSIQAYNSVMRMFNETNAYRISLGLTPYTYNYEQQACVTAEAAAYAANKNPHNWVCSAAANENASLGGVNSDYVAVSMNFFKTDPPHEAVLSGQYRSVAIAMVLSNGTYYIIMDVFN